MKLYHILGISSLLLYSSLQASLVAINDSTSVNKFLGDAIPACSSSTHNCNKGDVTISSMYADQRQTLDGLLGINFAQHKDRVIYLFNEFGYWSGKRSEYINSLSSSSVYTNQTSNDLGLTEQDPLGMLKQQVQSKYPGPGVYIIAISAIPDFVNRVGKNVSCDSSGIKVAAILFYDDGNGLQPLSASCIAVRPNDKFSLNISSNNSGAVSLPKGSSAFSSVLTTSSSGTVNFQACQITTTIPTPPAAAPADSGSASSSTKKSSKKTTDATRTPDPTPVVTFGAPENLGSSPQSILLKKM